MRIRKGDTVQVLTRQGPGQARPRSCVAIPEAGKVIVDGVNVAKRHTKPTPRHHAGRDHRQGHADAGLVGGHRVPGCGGPTRIGMRIDEQGRKIRICRKCGAEL